MRTLWAALVVILLGSCAASTSDDPTVRQGTLDLTSWDWHEALPLRGDWTVDGHPQPVPAALSFGGQPYGLATYHLHLSLPATAPALALRFPLVGTAFELRANGQLLAHEGRVAAGPEGAVPSYRPRFVLLPPPVDGGLDLEVRVSNWHDQFAGLYGAPLLGPEPQIRAEAERSILGEAAMFGALLLLGLYHAGSFLFRTRHRAPLWFGVFCILVALRSTFYSETLFLQWFPDASWFVVIRGVYATMSLALLAFAAYLDRLYPQWVWRPATWMAGGVGGAYALINLFAPVGWTTALLVPFQIAMLAFGVFALAVVVRALRHREPGAGLFVAGMAIFLLTIVFDVVKNHFFWEVPSLVSLGTVAFLLMQSLVVARLFAMAFTAVERHSVEVEKINSSLERFIPREVLGFLGKSSITEISLGDFSEQKMTVFFLDIRNFTGLSESMTPRENFRFINSFLRQFGPVVRDHNGFVDKYLGDGIMALFPGRADEALDAALAMRQALKAYNEGRARGGYTAIRFGIGLHTGPLMLGTIGENRRMDSTVISDTVNAASRLEGLTKKYEEDILLSGETVDALVEPERFEPQFVASETVKGRQQPVRVYRLVEAAIPD